jgi:hypothetical protein
MPLPIRSMHCALNARLETLLKGKVPKPMDQPLAR